MTYTILRRKIASLIAVRAVFGTVLLGTGTIAQITAPGSFPIDPFFFLIALTYGLTILWAVTLRAVDRARWLIDLQLGADAMLVTAFIYVTGGITSYFSSLYFLPIIAAAVVRHRNGALMVASLSSLPYLAVVALQYSVAAGVLQDPWLSTERLVLPSTRVAQYTVALNVFGFYAVALLAGSLAESVRSAGARLELASHKIADLKALNQHVIDSLPSGLATTDTAQRILTFNRAAEHITGLSFPSVVGRRITEVLQLPAAFAEAFDRDLAGASTRRVEFRYTTADKRGEIDIGLTATHLQTPSGRAGFLMTFQDLTDIKKRERDAHLQQRLAAVGEMAAGIAHEIRNPLASMSGSIQILRQELPLTPEQAQLMDIVLRESERLNTTIRSFLAYARPQRFAIATLDIRRALNDTALLLRNGADLHERHTIAVDLPEEALILEADENQIKQIVWNLATNGLRAMPDGGELQLSAASNPATGVVITVRDQGIGIPPGEIDGLFQPFHGSFAKGSGLGLAIVHRIVTDYNGEIHVSSRPGSGTTVSVTLPTRAGVGVAS
jgi:two-component system sensor histidine kinase PilS (NtrC family)